MREIVEVGSQVLLAKGLWAVNKRRIAEQLGISDGNVGYYFATREALWTAIIDHEMEQYYRRHHPPSAVPADDPQARFDEYILNWIDEYEDNIVRIFFSQIITVAEVNGTIAKKRDEIYEAFFEQIRNLARPLVPDLAVGELEQRVLATIALLEGLHAVSAFRPATVTRDDQFRQRMLGHINDIIRS